MKAGFFETDITPPIGSARPGYIKRFLNGIHDPLKVRSAVFEGSDKRVALVGIDTSNIGFDSINEAKNEIFERCGISPENICIGASHTHSGGAASALSQLSDMAKLPPEIYELAVNRSARSTPSYREWVVKQIISAVCEADNIKEEALVSIGIGYEKSMVFNRRFKMKNGRVYTHPGKLNPDIIEAAGPVDPDVGVIGAWRKDGSLIGCIVNYACHATCDSSARASADWVHYLQKTIRKMMGGETGVVFLNGACGDITQVDNLSYTVDGGQAVAEKLGGRVGAEVVKVLLSSDHETFNEVDAACVNLRLKRRKPNSESVEKSWAIIKSAAQDDTSTEFIFAKERILADYIYSVQPEIDVPISAIKIGNAIFLTNPSEYFCQLGLDIKADSPFYYTFVASLTNGTIGYVPTTESFNETGGGYETALTSYSNMEVQAGEKICLASVALAKQFMPEKVSEKAKSKSWKTPWEYGVLGPDIN
jgi:hypothetical protein